MDALSEQAGAARIAACGCRLSIAITVASAIGIAGGSVVASRSPRSAYGGSRPYIDRVAFRTRQWETA
jgi:hypothetical protein